MTTTMTINAARDSFLELIRYRRPGRSATEKEFIETFIDPLGCTKDEYGNRILRIGTAPVMWSCHTDTVHRMGGTQNVKVVNYTVSLDDASSNCLGADCTTGVWIMIEMIKAGKEGLYIFHRDEESGGRGSTWIVENTPELVKDIQMAIAFDRYGTTSIITHQMSRCCSDDFADSMIEQMDGFRKDPGGIFTDTAFYTDLIPECTNVSVGYDGHHGMSERQNLLFLVHLLELILELDISKLRVSRDPEVVEEPSRGKWANHYDWDGEYGEDGYYGMFQDAEDAVEAKYTLDENAMIKMIKANPEAAASLFRLYGITTLELMEHAFSTNSRYSMAS